MNTIKLAAKVDAAQAQLLTPHTEYQNALNSYEQVLRNGGEVTLGSMERAIDMWIYTEQQLLACLMAQDAIYIHQLITNINLQSEDFFLITHQIIFDAIKDIAVDAYNTNDTNLQVTVLLVAQKLSKLAARKINNMVVKPSDVVSNVTLVFISNARELNFTATTYLMRDVKYASLWRQMQQLVTVYKVTLMENPLCFDIKESARYIDTLKQIQDQMVLLSQGVKAETLNVTFEQLEDELIERSLERQRNKITGIPTPIRWWNEDYDGLRRGELTIWAARSGTGKTTLAINIILHVLQYTNYNVVMLSSEMKSTDLLERMFAIKRKLPLSSVLGGYLPPNALRQHLDEERGDMERWGKRYTVIPPSESVIIEPILTSLENYMFASERKIDLLVVDHLQSYKTIETNVQHYERARVVAQRLKTFALEHNIAVLLLSQVNHDDLSVNTQGKAKAIDVSQISTSKSVREVADMIFVSQLVDSKEMDQRLWTNAEQEYIKHGLKTGCQLARVTTGKARRARAGVVHHLVFNAPFGSFETIEI